MKRQWKDFRQDQGEGRGQGSKRSRRQQHPPRSPRQGQGQGGTWENGGVTVDRHDACLPTSRSSHTDFSFSDDHPVSNFSPPWTSVRPPRQGSLRAGQGPSTSTVERREGEYKEDPIRAAQLRTPFAEEVGPSSSPDGVQVVAEVQSGHQVNSALRLRDPFLPSGSRVLAFLQLCQDSDVAPQDLRVGAADRASRLTMELWGFFRANRQTPLVLRKKIDLWSEIDRALRSRWRCRTLAFGSTLSGFGTNASDMDLCVFCDHDLDGRGGGNDANKKRKRGDVEFLFQVRKTLRRFSLASGDIKLIPANVSILKFSNFRRGLDVDLSSNSPAGAFNTHMLYCYSQMDSRVRPLILVLKHWAKQARINDASECTLSSYVLSLLAINYLQCGVTPPVVPSLQQMYPNVFQAADADIFTLPYLAKLPQFKSHNHDSLGSLFLGFFDHLATRLDFSNDVPSVRLGRLLTNHECESFARRHDMSPRQWTAYVCVEEPFERSNAARAVVRRDAFDRILWAARSAKQALGRGAAFYELTM